MRSGHFYNSLVWKHLFCFENKCCFIDGQSLRPEGNGSQIISVVSSITWINPENKDD